jgi:hypothetical protein
MMVTVPGLHLDSEQLMPQPTGALRVKETSQSDMSQAARDEWEEFHNLCLLVTLVTAINNSDGCLKLYLSGVPSANSEDSRNAQTVMHTITSILVLEHKILACMIETDLALGSVVIVQDDRYEIDDEDGKAYKVDAPVGKL